MNKNKAGGEYVNSICANCANRNVGEKLTYMMIYAI